ncbi:MAG: glutamate racemase [Candidatus Eremiobacteraeota bacterium]|nr:glutamate racemase [Candidatus Eremiobacteraeota bacterium]
MLGVFDSGLGGLSVVRRLKERLPHHALLFFADQAHVPYGDRKPHDLASLLASNVGFLNEAGVSIIVMGCNTSCAIAQQFGWPQSHAPILDLIESAALVVQRDGLKNVGVVATTATVSAQAYSRAIVARVPSARVFEVAAPALVPLVEAGKAGTEEAHEAVAAVCKRLPRDLDAVILACTHYPILDLHFADALSEGVVLIDPAVEQAGRAAQLAVANGIARGIAPTTYVTSGDVERFRTAVRMITGEFDPNVRSMSANLTASPRGTA